MRILHISCLVSISLWSAAAQVARPTLGYAYDAGLGAIRPIWGIPGAAILGDPVNLGVPLDAAAVSPQQAFALATAAGSGQVQLVRFQPGAATMSAIADAIPAPSLTVFSPSGRSALLYERSSGRLQVLAGLPDTPSARFLNTTGVTIEPVALAISDDGALALVASGSQDSDPVWLLASDGTSLQLPMPGSTAAVSFRANSHDAVAATRSGDIYLLRNLGVATDLRQVYLGDDRTADPVAVAISSDAARAYAANAKGSLAIVDFETGTVNAVSCQCTPGGLDPLQYGPIFRLTGISHRPLLLFDGSAAEPRVWFVPPDQVRPVRRGVAR